MRRTELRDAEGSKGVLKRLEAAALNESAQHKRPETVYFKTIAGNGLVDSL